MEGIGDADTVGTHFTGGDTALAITSVTIVPGVAAIPAISDTGTGDVTFTASAMEYSLTNLHL